MGRNMAGHLVTAGHDLMVTTRTRSKAEPLLALGATWAETPLDIAKSCDIVFSIVSEPRDVREVYLGTDGLLVHGTSGQVLVDMTTSEPGLAKELHEIGQKKGISVLDAPVSGGEIGSKNATLSVMVGGEQKIFEQIRPYFECMGKTIVYQGPTGSGQHTKMVNQTLIATCIVGVCEALVYAYKAGLDIETVLQSVSTGAAGSWSLSFYGAKIANNDMNPGFYIDHFVKDMGIVLDEARKMQLALPGLALAQQLYLSLQAHGEGRLGIQALQLGLSRLSNIDWLNRSTK